MAISAGRVTRLGIDGGIWQPLDTSLFDNKVPVVPDLSGIATRFGLSGGIARPIDISLYNNKVPGEPIVPPVEEPGSGGGPIFRPERPREFGHIISFKGLSFEAFEEPIPIEESSKGIQLEINRFQSVIDMLESQMGAIDQEIALFKERADLIRAKMLEEEVEQVRLFIADLLLQILLLRKIKRRRLEEEQIIIILMLNE